jgi:hypothetical protein
VLQVEAIKTGTKELGIHQEQCPPIHFLTAQRCALFCSGLDRSELQSFGTSLETLAH